ncbi:MAG: hypothetical protein ACRDH6_09330 [Actinomycetota bacterium]
MTSHFTRRLASVDREVCALATELTQLREQLAVHEEALEESRLRLLVAETPVADRDHQRTFDAYRGVEEGVLRLEQKLGELRDERRRLERAISSRPTVAS